MKSVISIILFIVFQLNLKATNTLPFFSTPQNDTLTWAILNNVEFKEVNHKEYGPVFLPTFSKEIKKYDRKKVIIKGYLIPVDKETWALSKNVNSSCFFCGKSGPETVIGLTFKTNSSKLKMDASVYISGTFKLNGTDVDDWMYTLENAELLFIK